MLRNSGLGHLQHLTGSQIPPLKRACCMSSLGLKPLDSLT